MQEIEKNKISLHCILASIYFLLLPLSIATNSGGNSILKLASIPIGGYFLISLVFSGQRMHINTVHLFLLFYTFTTAFTLFVEADTNSIKYVIGYFLNAALYICISVVQYNKTEILVFENVQVALLAIITFWTLISGGMSNDRTTLSFFGQASDPNYFVGFFVFPLAITMKKVVESKYRILYLLLVAAACYAIFLSGSRGGFLSILVTIGGFAVLYPRKMKHRVMILTLGLGSFFILLKVFWPLLPDIIVKRLSVESVVESGGTGRVDIWKSMIREIIDSPDKLLFGRGIMALHPMVKDGKFGYAGAHNQLLQVLYNQGLVGLVAFLLLTGACFFRCVGKRSLVSVAILGMMALSVSLSFNQTTRTFWNLVAYAAFIFPEDETNAAINDGGIQDHGKTLTGRTG